LIFFTDCCTKRYKDLRQADWRWVCPRCYTKY